jgi:hypothetical protein
MKENPFPTPGAQEALVSYFISITRDDTEAVAGVVSDFVKSNGVEEIPRAFPDARMAAIATAAYKSVFANPDFIPTPEMIAQWLIVNQVTRPFASADPGKIANIVRTIVTDGRGTITPSIMAGRFLLNDILKVAAIRRESYEGAEAARDAIVMGQGTPEERHAKALELLDKATPPTSSIEILDGQQLMERYVRTLAFRLEFARMEIPFMRLPEEIGLDKFIPRLIPGDVTLIVGDPKSGKSSLARNIAERNAQHGNGFVKVLYIHLEDGHDKVADRTVSKYLGFSGESLRQGEHIEEVQKLAAEQMAWGKHLRYMHAPNIKPHDIAKTVRSMALGLPDHGSLIVIIDYLNENKLDMRFTSGDNTAERLASAMQVFKSMTEGCSRGCTADKQYKGYVHTVIFQQQNENGTTLGGQSGYRFAQNVIHLERARAGEGHYYDFTEEMNRTELPTENQLEFKVKPGDMIPAILFRIKYANDGEPGKCAVLFNPSRFLFVRPMDNQDKWNEYEPVTIKPSKRY